jgi:HK97 family phage portal protein
MGLVSAILDRPRNAGPPVPFAARSAQFGIFGASGGSTGSQLDAFGSNGTLFAIVDALANGTAQAQWKLWRKPRTSGGQRVEVTSHAALDLLSRPNEFYTRQEMIESGQQHQDLTGETWLVVGRDERSPTPLELWVVRPDRMFPVKSADTFIAGYVYVGPSGERIPLRRDEVIMLRRPNPNDPYRGMGPVQSILADLDSARYSSQWNRNFFINSAQPDGIIEVDHDLDDAEFRTLTTRWSEQHQGVARAHRIGVLEVGQKWVERTYTMRDMQFVELRNVSREVIREAFRFPKPMLGTVEDVNRANADAAEVVFGRWHTKPRLERWKQALNNDLLPMFGDTVRDLEFDYEQDLPVDTEAEKAVFASSIESAIKLIERGVEPTAAFEAVGLPPMAMVTQDRDATRRLSAVEALQKIYLATEGGVIITPPEARAMINELGGDLVLPGPFPTEPEPAPEPVAPEPAPVAAAVVAVLDRINPAATLAFRNGRAKLSDEDMPDLGRMQSEWETGLAALVASFGTVKVRWFDALVAQIRTAISDGDVEALATLSVPQAAVTDGAELLADAMVALAQQAAGHVVDEARDQGVQLDPQAPEHQDVSSVAGVVVALLAAGLAISAGGEALRVRAPDSTPADVGRRVAEFLDGLTSAQEEKSFGGALTGAQNKARIATMKAGPTGAVYASEILDTATCKPCRAVHGRWLGNTEDLDLIEKTYPGGAFGGYVDCLGRDRCRGTVVGVWRPKTTED